MKRKDLVAIAVVVICIALSACLPTIGFLCTMLGAMLCGALYVRCGWRAVMGAVVLGAAAAFGATQSVSAAVVAAFGSAVPGCAMMAVQKRKTGMRDMLMAGTVGFLAQTLLDFGIVRIISGKNVFTEMMYQMQQTMQETLPQMRAMLEANGTENVDETMQMLSQLYSSMAETVSQLLPSVLFILCGIMAYIVLCGCAALLRRDQIEVAGVMPFTQLHASRGVAAALLVMFAISMVASQRVICAAALNITILLFAYFVVCGISLLCFYMKRWFPQPLLRTLVAIPMFFVLCSMMLLPVCNPMQLLLMAGILDSAFHFRTGVRRRVK